MNSTVLIEPQEGSVVLYGYSATLPKAIAIANCQVGAVSYNSTSQIFSVRVTPLQATRSDIVQMSVAIGPNPVTMVLSQNQARLAVSSNAITTKQGGVAIAIGYIGDFSVRIFNMGGQLLFSRDISNQMAWTSPDNILKQGMYLVNVVTPFQSIVKKCMIR
jgi:hypothetical protein